MHVLSSISLVDIYAIHPNTAASYRETFKPNGAKTDQIDSLSILDLFIKHPEKIQKYKPAQATDFLGQYCEKRRAIVDDRKAVGNQLTAALKKSFPVVLKIFKDTSIYGPIVLYFLKKWSNIASLKNASIQSIKNFFAKKSSKIAKTEQRLQHIKDSQNFLEEEFLDLYTFEISCLVQRLENLNGIIKQYDQKINQLYKQNKDYEIFNSFHGAGASLGPRVLAFFGNDRDKFSSANDAAVRSEIAPVKIQSGKSEIIRRRFLCNKFLQQTFVELAMGSLTKSKWAKAYYDQAKKAKVTHYTILRALAFKWIRIIYACWKNDVKYDEQKHIEMLIKKRSPIVNNLQLAC